MSYQIKKTFLSLFLTGFSFIGLTSLALLSPQVYFTEINLTKESFLPGEKIQGDVSLWNYESYLMGDLVFQFELLGGEKNGVATQVIDSQRDSNIFSLSADEKATKPFVYNLPSNLPAGTYKFRIQLTNAKGEEMTWIDKVIEIGGEGRFLFLDNYWIIKEGKNLAPGGGVSYQSGEVCQIGFDVTNNSNFTITAFPRIITYKRNIGQSLQQTEGENIIIAPKQKKSLQFSLPKLTEPESYLSEVRFYDTEEKKPISNSIYFRWVISGTDDAEILFVNPEKDSYEAGEEAEIQIQYTGPAHLHLEANEVEKGEALIKIYDENGELVGEGKKEIELDTNQIKVNVPIEKDVKNPKIVSQIVKEGEELDQYQIQVKSKAEAVKEAEEKISFWQKNKNIILAILIILILGVLIYSFKKTKVKTVVLLALFLAGILFGNSTFAASQVVGGCCDTTIVFNSPVPNLTYNPGDIVNFSGKFRVTGCGNGLFFNKITFYIAEDKEIPITDCCGDEIDNCELPKNCNCSIGCQNCYGAISDTYASCDIQWCDEVKYLNENQGYKIYKLGEIYPADVQAGDRPYWVEYNQDFIIPSFDKLGFAGPVRLYVQYSGTHWQGHWHWNIAYQNGYINKFPTVSNLSQTWNHCAIKELSIPTFHWNYNPGTYPQGGFEIKIYGNNTLDETIDSSSNNYTPANDWIRDNLSWNKSYTWQVRVKDSEGNWSVWSDLKSFTTPLHAYPWPNFTHTPPTPTVGEVVTFNDASKCYTSANTERDCKDLTNVQYAWDFDYQDFFTVDSTQKGNTTTTFAEVRNYEVRLRITDSSLLAPNNYCIGKGDSSIGVTPPLPEYQEIPPTGFLKNFFSQLVKKLSFNF